MQSLGTDNSPRSAALVSASYCLVIASLLIQTVEVDAPLIGD